MKNLLQSAEPLNEEDAETVFAAVLDGTVDDRDIARFLIELAGRGETASELAGAARAMRARMIPVMAPDNAIDVCGTGGDGQHTLNVSTAVALVVAACGVPVAKHGNRAASSKSGAADTLEALGLNLDRAVETAEETLDSLGICFLFAARHHPAMGRIMPIRREIGRRTIFNLLGPLANPAGVRRQLVGIPQPDFVPIYADALSRLGADRAIVVSGEEGLDEISISNPSRIACIGMPQSQQSVAPEDANLPRHGLEALLGGDAAFNAAALRALLDGAPGAYRDAVLLNAAGALLVADKAASWGEGALMAAQALDEGRSNALLGRWIAATL